MKFATMIAGSAMTSMQPGIGVGMGMGHGLAMTIGALLHIKHGESCGLCLVPAIRQAVRIGSIDEERLVELGAAFGLALEPTADVNELADEVCLRVEWFLDLIGQPRASDFGWGEEWIDQITEAAMRSATVTSTTTREEVYEYVKYIFAYRKMPLTPAR